MTSYPQHWPWFYTATIYRRQHLFVNDKHKDIFTAVGIPKPTDRRCWCSCGWHCSKAITNNQQGAKSSKVNTLVITIANGIMASIITEYPQFFTATNLEWKKLLCCVVGDCPALGYRHEHQQRQKTSILSRGSVEVFQTLNGI